MPDFTCDFSRFIFIKVKRLKVQLFVGKNVAFCFDSKD